MIGLRRAALLLTAILLLAGCQSDAKAPPAAAPSAKTPPGLRFRLTDAAQMQSGGTPLPRASATPLSASDIAQLLSRMKPLPSGQHKAFAMREKSLPPPQTGTNLQQTFPPPPQTAPTPDSDRGPLSVLRHAPDGEVPLAPNLSVTFSQPMVPLTSHAVLAAMEVPLKLRPTPPGEWRWVGTRTLLFQPKTRLPMATRYEVTVPAATRSALGNKLATAASWTFTTPPPRLASYAPTGGPQGLQPLFFVGFDQQVEPQSVLSHVRVVCRSHSNSNSHPSSSDLPLRLATSDEVHSDDAVSALAAAAEKGRWLAFKTQQPLPADSAIDVTVGAGTPSTEGPLQTTQPQSYSFYTYGPMKVVEHHCSYNDADCRPLTPFYIRFSNPIEEKTFANSMIRVQPPIDNMKISVSGDSLTISGRTRGRTTYAVSLDGAIPDKFGQTLGKTETVEFKVGSAEPLLYPAQRNFVVLDPTGRPTYSVYSINHPHLRVRLFKVTPDDWARFAAYMRDYAGEKPSPPPGRLISEQMIEVKGEPDELVETPIDLRPALSGTHGQVFVEVAPPQQPKERWRWQRVQVWTQVTAIGLDALVDREQLLAWATSLSDGRPMSGVEVQLLTHAPQASSSPGAAFGPLQRQSGKTSEGGVAALELPQSTGDGPHMLVARRGDDMAMLPENASYYYSTYGSWTRVATADALRWYVVDDRNMYRPGEEVHVKGWIRRVGAGKTGQIGGLQGCVTEVSYALRDSRGNEVLKGTTSLDPFGGFHMAFPLPKTMNLGYSPLTLSASGGNGGVGGTASNLTVQVQEFRRPEFEVAAAPSQGPFFVGGQAYVTVTASYYAGGGLSGAPVSWYANASPAYFSPPGRSGFSFGHWTPWWGMEMGGGEEPTASSSQSCNARTDSAGKQQVRLDFDSVRPPGPSSVHLQATVMDVNRQAWTAQSDVLVHPSKLYVGLRSPRTFVEEGQAIEVEAIVCDLDGKAVLGKTVTLHCVRLESSYSFGRWKQEEIEAGADTLTSAKDAVKTTFHPRQGGTYRIRATVEDDQHRPNQSDLVVWMAGGRAVPQRDVTQEQVKLIPDKDTYQPGDVAEILVSSPFAPADGLMSLRRNGVLHYEMFHMEGPTHTLKIPITDQHYPGLSVQVDLVGSAARVHDNGEPDPSLPRRPAYGVGALTLPVPPLKHTLGVKAVPKDEALPPGGNTTVALEVHDAANQPLANAQALVVVVDESVLALTNYKFADPMSVFYAMEPGGVRDYHSRAHILLDDPQALQQNQLQAQSGSRGEFKQALGLPASAPGAAGGAMDHRNANEPMGDVFREKSEFGANKKGGKDESTVESSTPIRVRTNLNPLATFATSVTTDASGHATVPVHLPDNLTRYRVMVVAVAERDFGAAESAITARLPLMVRPSAPRFLNFGDRFEMPIVLQNQTSASLPVKIAMRASNARITDHAGYQVTVPANDRVEVRIPTATEDAGTAKFQIAASSGSWADASELSLPVWTPATTEAFATYGEIDQGAARQPVRPPAEVFPQFGGLEITTSSTALQALTDAVLYLQSYPFECAEQLSSRLLAVAGLRDVLAAFSAEGLPAPDKLLAQANHDIERLRNMQNEDGGFAFWRRGDESWPFLALHVTHALVRAKEKGFAVPSDTLTRAQGYLKDIEAHIPYWYPLEVRWSLIAYSLYVRDRMGDHDAARAHRLIAEATVEKLPMEAVGWLLFVLSGDKSAAADVTALRRHVMNHVTEEAGTANFVTHYSDGGYLLLSSDRRVDGVLLEALMKDQPKSDLIPKIVRGLLAHRTRGHWGNTQENAWVLLAMDRYFHQYEKATPDFVARVWLGDGFAGEHAFKGRTTEKHNISIPMQSLGKQDVIIGKSGPGRLYYRIGMQYAPKDLKPPPMERGFTVERVYEAVDQPADVRHDASDDSWHIKAGALVRVRITMVAPTRRYHVALVDPLPAGLEALNSALAVTGTVPPSPSSDNPLKGERWRWWSGWWYEHENLRDERVEAFTSLLWDGVYSYTYVARATTPGRFVVPATHAEEMYSPEVFGRGSAAVVVVE